MGWVMLALIGVAVSLALWLGGVSRSLWSFAGAALMLGAAGYAVQQRASLPGHPVESFAEPIELDPTLIELRDSMLGRFSADGAYLVAADAMTRSGDTRSAVEAVLGGLRNYPKSLTLWTGLGSAYAQHDGTVSPAALFAFRHAAHLAPLHPAPPFFLGLAYVRSGQLAQARPYWARALALTPPGLSYHAQIETWLKKLDDYLAAADRAQAQAAASAAGTP
jgi:tetratricopeptide (TPR) repeat protein